METCPPFWVDRINILKMIKVSYGISRLNSILSKITFFTLLKIAILNFIWNQQRPRITKKVERKKTKNKNQCW